MPQKLIEYLVSLKKSGEYVAPGMRSKNRISRRFRYYADQIGLNTFTFHNLRDTYASFMVQNGMHLVAVKELLGHEDIRTTLIYAGIAPENKMQAIEIMAVAKPTICD